MHFAKIEHASMGWRRNAETVVKNDIKYITMRVGAGKLIIATAIPPGGKN